jgi:hypothetical protein
MKNFEVKNSTFMRIGEEIYTNPIAFLIVPNNCPSEKTGSMKIFVTWNLIGARFYDPMLGMWLMPDPKGQFSNPYTQGGDQVNFVDPDKEFIIAAIIIGAVVGAYLGGAAANGDFNPLDWDYSDGDTWIGMGVGAVLGGASGGAIAGGLALGRVGGAALLGGGIGSGVGLLVEGSRQAYTGQSSLGNFAAAWGAGAVVGAASGALIGGAIGMGVGAYHGETAKGTLIGGAAGLVAGSTVVGASYALEYGASLDNGIHKLINSSAIKGALPVFSTLFTGLAAGVGGLASYGIARVGYNDLKNDYKKVKVVYEEVKPLIDEGMKLYDCYKQLESLYSGSKGFLVQVHRGNYDEILYDYLRNSTNMDNGTFDGGFKDECMENGPYLDIKY